MKTYAQILADASQYTQDTGNAIFATTEFDSLMPQGLLKVSEARPWMYKLTKTTTIDSYDISLTAGDKWRLMTGYGYKHTGIQYAEYLVDQNPMQKRGVSRFGDTLTLEVSSRPSTAVSVYLFMDKIHLLQKTLGTTDTALAIKTQAAVGAVSLILKSAGTGTVEEMTTLTIAGDTTTYYVTAQATIAANEVTVSIWPPLAVLASVDAVVTLALTDSTLDYTQETLLGRWLAAKASISKATTYYGQVNTCITTLSNAATAIAAIAARITQAGTDIASGRTAVALGVTAITEADTELDKTVTAIDLAKTAIASGLALANTIPVGGGLNDYLLAASGDIGEANGRMSNGQAYLQKASADFSNAASDYQAAAGELNSASQKISEANVNLSLITSRLRVSDGGRNYEAWGRQELAKVEAEINAYAPWGIAQTFPRD